VYARFARRELLDEKRLCEAIARAERGSIDGNLSTTLIKQRVPRQVGGRSGGYRTVIAYRGLPLWLCQERTRQHFPPDTVVLAQWARANVRGPNACRRRDILSR
jgi:hypothetical protein